MKGNRLLAITLLLATSHLAVAQDNALEGKVIYKWTGEDNLIHYSHIKPTAVSNFQKLDAQGREIVDFTEDFDEIIEITVRRPIIHEAEQFGDKASTQEKNNAEIAKKISEGEADSVKQKNCQTAKKNLAMLNAGEVYEKDSSGNMIRLKPEQIMQKRKNVERDVDYFCGESSAAQ